MRWRRAAKSQGRDGFAAAVLARFEERGAGPLYYDRDEFSIGDDPVRPQLTLNLASTFTESERDPDNRDAYIDRLVQVFLFQRDHSGVPSWPQVVEQLRPVLRPSNFDTGADMPEPLKRPFLPFIAEMVVIDRPTSMVFVNEHTVDGWPVSSEEVFDAARGTMGNHRIEAMARATGVHAGAYWLADDGDSYVVSHLIVDGWLASLADVLPGRPVAFAPDIDTLLIAADEPDALLPLFDHARDLFASSGRALSPMAYTVDSAGRVVAYTGPEGHPVQSKQADALRALATWTE